MTSELVERAGYAFARRRFAARRLAPGAPLVVFSMPKTGSSAIAAALRALSAGPVHHVHDLDPDRLDHEELEYHWSGRPWRIWDARRLLATPATVDRPWTVVSLVRDPIAQTVSAFFQPGARRGYLRSEASVEDLLERFGGRLDHLPLHWFERHLQTALGIDVFDHPFDHAHRFQIVDTPTVRLLLLRTEDLAVAPVGLATLLGRAEPVAVPRMNVGADKSYAALYARFRGALRPSPAQLDHAYGSRVARHFYSEGEINRFRMVWSHQAPDAGSLAPITDEAGR